jgi:diadenosine tetraphosphate (Ap4A) HIT family hydrolase
MSDCHTCELVERRDAGEAPPWDAIVRYRNWDVVHAFGTSLDGWLVLVVRRHVAAVADLTDDEAAELGPLVKAVSVALAAAVGCEKTYVVQFAEAERHRHVHVHVIPRQPDQAPELKGPRIFNCLGVPEDEAVPVERMDEVARAVRRLLDARPPVGLSTA